MTIRDIEDAARLILLDTDATAYRFEPKEIFNALKAGIERTRSIRPESRYVAGHLVESQYPDVPVSFSGGTETGSLEAFRSNSFQMEEKWREPLVFYVVSRMYLKDDTDTQNAELAKTYMNLYMEGVQS